MADLAKLESKLDKLDERLDSIDKTLAVNTVHLGEHMRRTELLEKRTDKLEDDTAIIKSVKLLSLLTIKFAAVVGSIFAILEVLKQIKG